jgi:hypothetical protein
VCVLQVTNNAFELHNFPWQEKRSVAFGRANHNFNPSSTRMECPHAHTWQWNPRSTLSSEFQEA